MNSFLKCLRKLKERELYRLSEAIDLELQRRFVESNGLAVLEPPADSQHGDADVLSMPVAQSGPRRAA